MGAPVGNSNASRGKVWRAAIERALETRSRLEQKHAVDTLAGVLLDKAAEGDMAALKELGDRLDGKPAQTVGSDPDQPLRLEQIQRIIVDPKK
jgi:hypothetical protein